MVAVLAENVDTSHRILLDNLGDDSTESFLLKLEWEEKFTVVEENYKQVGGRNHFEMDLI